MIGNLKNTAIASSVSTECGWDPLDTLTFTREMGVNCAQLFLSEAYRKNTSLVKESSLLAWEWGIEILCHSPVDLTEEILNEELTEGFNTLLQYQDTRDIVVHHNPSVPLKQALHIIKEMKNRGLRVCLENFYPSPEDIGSVIDDYLLLMKEAQGLNCAAVIDVPRLYVDPHIEEGSSRGFVEKLLTGLKGIPLILHLLDCMETSHNRELWCPVGQGIIPYSELLTSLGDYPSVFEKIVLELDEKKHIEPSLCFLRELSTENMS